MGNTVLLSTYFKINKNLKQIFFWMIWITDNEEGSIV